MKKRSGRCRSYDAASIGTPRRVPSPLSIDQPLGPGFRLGHVVEWRKWRFHVRPDQRVGAIISTVTYGEGDQRRPILYQGSLSEICRGDECRVAV